MKGARAPVFALLHSAWLGMGMMATVARIQSKYVQNEKK